MSINYSPRCNPATAAKARVICIVGSSGSGKSAAISYLREKQIPNLVFPSRVTTRTPRPDDDPEENTSVSGEIFREMEAKGDFLVSWKKSLPGVGDFFYGIEKPQSLSDIAVLSGNNALAKEVSIPDSLIVEIFADESIRERRIIERSPHLDATELSARVTAKDQLSPAEIDIQIVNEGELEGLHRSLDEIIELLEEINPPKKVAQ